jgi:inner membrane transporter RhtA
MSVHPVMAALAGFVLLGQSLAAHEWLGMAIVVTVNATAVVLSALDTSRAGRQTPGRADAARRLHPSGLGERIALPDSR